MTSIDPVIARRRLRTELKRTRQDVGRTQVEVARAMDWSTAKLIRIEGGDARITQNDLKALVGYYGIDDAGRLDDLLDLARTARQEDRWEDLSGLSTPGAVRYLSYESSAAIIRGYQPLLVPGLLQTEEYVVALLRDMYELREDDSARLCESRHRRQELHERLQPPTLQFIVDEAVIHRPVGGPRIMRRQLIRLQEYAAQSHVTLQVMPFSVGAHPGLNSRFVYLEFADPHDEDVLFLEEPDQIVREDPEQTATYLERFFRLQDLAAPPERTPGLLERAITEMDEMEAAGP